MRIGRRQPPVFKDRHRSPADVVVEAIDRAGDELAGIVGRGIHGGCFREQGGGRRHDKKGPFDCPGRLVLEQVGVILPVGGEQLVEQHRQHSPRLVGVAKSGLRRLEFGQAVAQHRGHEHGRIRPLANNARCGRLDLGVEIVHGPPGRRIKSARREVQIPHDHGGGVGSLGRRVVPVHPSAFSSEIANQPAAESGGCLPPPRKRWKGVNVQKRSST